MEHPHGSGSSRGGGGGRGMGGGGGSLTMWVRERDGQRRRRPELTQRKAVMYAGECARTGEVVPLPRPLEEFPVYEPPACPLSLDEEWSPEVAAAADQGEVASLLPLLHALTRTACRLRGGEVVTFRNNLNKILLTPYQWNSPWRVGVRYLPRGVLLLNIMPSDAHYDSPAADASFQGFHDALRAQAERRSEQDLRRMYWGRRFEEVAVRRGSATPQRWRQVFCMLATALEDTDFLVAAEIDARMPRPCEEGGATVTKPPTEPEARSDVVAARGGDDDARSHGGSASSSRDAASGRNDDATDDPWSGGPLPPPQVEGQERAFPSSTLSPAEFVELKTHRVLENEHQTGSFWKYKMMKAWLQSYLSGGEHVVIGHRADADGTLFQCAHHRVRDIPHHPDDKHECLRFGARVFQFLRAHGRSHECKVLEFLPDRDRRRVSLRHATPKEREFYFGDPEEVQSIFAALFSHPQHRRQASSSLPPSHQEASVAGTSSQASPPRPSSSVATSSPSTAASSSSKIVVDELDHS